MAARLLSFFLLILLIFSLSRALIRSLPGDPLDTLLSETGLTLPKELVQKELGLDQPFWRSTLHDLRQALHGDFGKSLFSRIEVKKILAERFANTALLSFLSLTLSLCLSLLIGLGATTVLERSRSEKFFNSLCSFWGALSPSLPTPWLGPILIYFFALKLKIFETSGQIFLPSITLAISFSGYWSRLIRSLVSEEIRLGSARGAKGRGIADWKIKLKYGLAPASGALLAYLGTQIGLLLTGAFVTEVVFNYPGMGSLLIDSILRRDYPVVEAALFLGACVCLGATELGNLAKYKVLRKTL